jgi:hypothetical protein
MKGQITVLNLIMVLITLFLYFAFIPVLSPMIEDTANYLTNNSTNQFSLVIIVLLDMVPFLLLVCIVITAFNYAIPRREGQ